MADLAGGAVLAVGDRHVALGASGDLLVFAGPALVGRVPA